MSLARKYNALFKRHLRHFAAWSPVTDRYEVGDFGVFRGGVFQSLGNIREFGVDPQPRAGAAAAKFSYTSSDAVIVRTQAGAEVASFTSDPVQAELSISFTGSSNFYIRTAELTVEEMPAADAVAYQLRGRKDANGRKWRLGWRVVRKVYTAQNPAILASLERDTKIQIAGQAKLLQQLEGGSASADISVNSSRSDVLEIMGQTGPVALDLFRVRVTGRAGLVSFAPGEDEDESDVGLELDDDWTDEAEDDPQELWV